MMDSAILSLFFFATLVCSLVLYKKYDLSILKRGIAIPRTGKVPIIIIVCAILVGAGLAFFYVYFSGPQLLQFFYITIFFVAWIVGIFFLIPIQNILFRILAAIGIALLGLVIVQAYPYQLAQNLYMALGILWTGAVLVRLFKIRLAWAIVVLCVALGIDVYNIFLSHPISGTAIFSDEGFFLNNLLGFGSAVLGIGDVFFALLVVAFTQKRFGGTPAIILAFLVSIPRVTLRIVFPELVGVTIPYFMILVPVTLFFWALLSFSKGKNIFKQDA